MAHMICAISKTIQSSHQGVTKHINFHDLKSLSNSPSGLRYFVRQNICENVGTKSFLIVKPELGVHVILFDKDGSSRDLGSWKQIFDIVVKRRDKLQEENPAMRATVFIYNDLNDVRKYYKSDDTKLKLIIKKKLSQAGIYGPKS